MAAVVYGLIDGDTLELRYIGQTYRPEQRLLEHRRTHRVVSHFNVWLGATPWTMIVLERDPEDLDEAERRWIGWAKTRGAQLFNVSDGGANPPSSLGRKLSDEARARIGASSRGRACSAETRAKISASLVNSPKAVAQREGLRSAEIRAKASASLRGHRCTAETRAKIGATSRGRKLSLAARVKISASSCTRWARPGEHVRQSTALKTAWARRREALSIKE